MTDNITLPREVVEKAIKAFENGCPPTCENGMIDSGGFHPWGEPILEPCPACLAFEHLRTHLAAPRPEPVAFDFRKAFRRAFDLGQLYGNDADRDSRAAQNRADKYRQEFDALCADALAHTAPPAAAPEPITVEPTPRITRITCGFDDVRFNGERWRCGKCGERMNDHYEEMVKHSNEKDYLELMQRKAAFKMGRDRT